MSSMIGLERAVSIENGSRMSICLNLLPSVDGSSVSKDTCFLGLRRPSRGLAKALVVVGLTESMARLEEPGNLNPVFDTRGTPENTEVKVESLFAEEVAAD